VSWREGKCLQLAMEPMGVEPTTSRAATYPQPTKCENRERTGANRTEQEKALNLVSILSFTLTLFGEAAIEFVNDSGHRLSRLPPSSYLPVCCLEDEPEMLRGKELPYRHGSRNRAQEAVNRRLLPA
jgi:hypothetical protein